MGGAGGRLGEATPASGPQTASPPWPPPPALLPKVPPGSHTNRMLLRGPLLTVSPQGPCSLCRVAEEATRSRPPADVHADDGTAVQELRGRSLLRLAGAASLAGPGSGGGWRGEQEEARWETPPPPTHTRRVESKAQLSLCPFCPTHAATRWGHDDGGWQTPRPWQFWRQSPGARCSLADLPGPEGRVGTRPGAVSADKTDSVSDPGLQQGGSGEADTNLGRAHRLRGGHTSHFMPSTG